MTKSKTKVFYETETNFMDLRGKEKDLIIFGHYQTKTDSVDEGVERLFHLVFIPVIFGNSNCSINISGKR